MKKVYVAVIALLAFLPGNPVLAQSIEQTIRGIVIDSLSKQPLSGATILVKNKQQASWSKQVVSSAKGIFEIKGIPKGILWLQVSYAGYRKEVMDSLVLPEGPLKELPFTFRLSIDPKQLKAVTVNGAKPFIVMDGDKIVMNVAESPLAAGSNAWDVLLRGPGVMEQNNELAFRNKSVTVLINGRLSHLRGEELKNFLSSMPANGIEKIELIGTPSVRYDAQGASVINIKLARNKNFGANGVLTAGVGSGRFLRYNSGLSLNYRNKKVNLYGGYDFQHNVQYFKNQSKRESGPDHMIREHEYEKRYRDNNSLRFGMDYDLSRTSSVGITVRGFMNFRDRVVNNTVTADRLKFAADSTSNVFTNGYARFASPSVNLYFKTTLDSTGKELTLNADYFSYHKTWTDDFITRYFDPEGLEYQPPYLLRDQSPMNVTVYSGTADYLHPSKSAKIELGAKTTFTTTNSNILWEYKSPTDWKRDGGISNHFIYREHINAAYVNLTKKIKKYSVQAGIRAEHTHTRGESKSMQQVNTNDFLNLFPNVNIQYQQSANQQWGLNYRKSINRYGFGYVNPAIIYQSQYAYSQGNPYLRPQVDHSIELSHTYKYQWFTVLNFVRAEKALSPVYRKNGNVLVSSYDNLGSYNMLMLTVTTSQVIKKKWTSVNTVGGFFIDINTKGQAESNKGNAALSAYLASHNTIQLPKKIMGEVTMMYRSPFASGIYKLNAYFVTSAGLSKPIWKGKGTLKASISDIFNTQRTISTVENYLGVNGEFTNKPESRFANVVLTWRFGNKNVKASKVRKSGVEEEKTRTGAN